MTVRWPVLLRGTLRANAAFSALSGLLLVFAGSRIAVGMGLPTSTPVWVLGLALVAFAAYVTTSARPALLDARAASVIAIADGLWVVGSIIVILFGPLMPTGNGVVAAVAVVVTAFAALQCYAIGHAVRAESSGPSTRLRIWGRRVLTGLAVSIPLVVALGAVDEAIQARVNERRYPPPGRLVDIGGYRLHINCIGTGDPTIVIDAGAGNWSVSWMAIQGQLAGDGRVCTFDRAGLGWSDPSPRPRTSATMADELHDLLHNAGVLPPFILVGHSLGGYNARMFADRYGNEVAALVLVESAHEHQWERLPKEVAGSVKSGIRQLRVASLMARLGLLHLVAVPDPHVARVAPGLQGAFGAALAEPKLYDAWRAEVTSVFESAAEVAHTRTLGDIPVVIVSAGRSFDAFRQTGADIPFEQANATWLQLQHELTQLSVTGVQLISQTSTHDINFDDPATVVSGIAYARAHARRPVVSANIPSKYPL